MAIAIPLSGCSRCWRYESGQRWRIPESEHMRQNSCGTTAWATTFPPCAKRFAMACSAIYMPFLARRCAFPCRTDDPPFPHGGVSPGWRMSCLPSSLNSLGTTGMPKDTLMAFAMTSGSLCAMRTLMQFYPLSSAEKRCWSGSFGKMRRRPATASPQSTNVLGRNHHHMKTKKLLAALLTLLIFLSPTFAAAETGRHVVLSHLPLRPQPHAGHRRHHHPQPRRAEHRLSA